MEVVLGDPLRPGPWKVVRVCVSVKEKRLEHFSTPGGTGRLLRRLATPSRAKPRRPPFHTLPFQRSRHRRDGDPAVATLEDGEGGGGSPDTRLLAGSNPGLALRFAAVADRRPRTWSAAGSDPPPLPACNPAPQSCLPRPVPCTQLLTLPKVPTPSVSPST